VRDREALERVALDLGLRSRVDVVGIADDDEALLVVIPVGARSSPHYGSHAVMRRCH
jgi:hypothetical protein